MARPRGDGRRQPQRRSDRRPRTAPARQRPPDITASPDSDGRLPRARGDSPRTQPRRAAWPDREVIVADNRSDDTIAGFAQRLLDNAPPKFVLIAHAMGGFVAFEVMRRAPERVAKLALIATLASADGPAQTARRQGYIDLVESGNFDQVVEERKIGRASCRERVCQYV